MNEATSRGPGGDGLAPGIGFHWMGFHIDPGSTTRDALTRQDVH